MYNCMVNGCSMLANASHTLTPNQHKVNSGTLIKTFEKHVTILTKSLCVPVRGMLNDKLSHTKHIHSHCGGYVFIARANIAKLKLIMNCKNMFKINYIYVLVVFKYSFIEL